MLTRLKPPKEAFDDQGRGLVSIACGFRTMAHQSYFYHISTLLLIHTLDKIAIIFYTRVICVLYVCCFRAA